METCPQCEDHGFVREQVFGDVVPCPLCNVRCSKCHSFRCEHRERLVEKGLLV